MLKISVGMMNLVADAVLYIPVLCVSLQILPVASRVHQTKIRKSTIKCYTKYSSIGNYSGWEFCAHPANFISRSAYSIKAQECRLHGTLHHVY